MRILGFELTRQKAMSPVADNRGWFRVLESYPGAWQQNVEVNRDSVLAYHAVYACMTLIASDIAKLRLKLVQRATGGVWAEILNPVSPLFTRPNHFQNRIQFFENWMLSKLSTGNAYILLERRDGNVTAFYVLDPHRVMPLVTDSGDVYYRLSADNLVGIGNELIVPASEIIHDRMNCIYHPLVGTSPIFASGVAATQGIRIQNNSANFFGNQSQPGGILVAPGQISDEDAARLKEYWDNNFTGAKAGKIAVVGDGLKYEKLGVTAHDAQLIEQLRWTAEVVCGTFHVPGFMVGVGSEPSYNNVQNLTLRYYSQCLQKHIEQIEMGLDHGLGHGSGLGVEFDLDDLLRMDTSTQYDVAQKAKGIATLDEQRRKLNLGPVEGGDTIYLQQQDHSLAAIAARDAQLIAQPDVAPALPAPADLEPDPEVEAAYLALYEKRVREKLNA